MRRPIVAGNWKMNMIHSEAVRWVDRLTEKLANPLPMDIVAAPPFTALSVVGERLKGSQIQLAGQNVHFETQGAYTGEISPAMLKDAGCDYVILGHSERRRDFKEDDALINRKVRAATRHGLKPILCVGETLAERQRDETRAVIQNQLDKGLEGVPADQLEALVIAYEPVWAIGTGKNATSRQAQEIHEFIRGQAAKQFGVRFAELLRIQYGGSVNPENSAELLSQPDIDGALVGGASLNADSFYAIIQSAN